jgi:hypothetical protein
MWLAGGDVLGSGTYAGDIIYSYDAVNWAPVGASQIFGNDVNYVGWNGQFWLALGNTPNSGTRIKYSANGFTWSNITGNDFSGWGAYAAWNGTMWVAVGSDTTNRIKYSFDTSNWYNATVPAGLNYGTGVTFGKNVWVASFFSSNANTSILYSSNGKNWRAIQSGGFPPIEFAFTDNYGYTVAFNGVYFLAGGAVNTSFPGSNAGLSSIQISFDGLNWSNARSGLLNTPSGFSWSGTMWVGAFSALSTRSTLRYSYNGLDWFAAESGGFSNASFNNWGKAAAFSSNASGALNVAGVAIPENSIVNNMNTTNTIFSYISSVVLNNILVVDRASNAVAINKTIGDYTLDVNGSLNMSSLFINASSINSVVTDVILRVTSGAVGAAAISTFSTLVTSSIAFVNVPPPQQCNLYIAVGYDTTASNTIRWSIDGFTWSNILSGGFTNFGNGGGFDVAFGGNMWVGVGTDSPDNNQTIIYSSNGLNWFEATGSLFTNGYGVAWNGRLWVAVGQDATSNGTIKYSGNGMVWSNARTGGFGTASSSRGQCVAWNGFQWLAGGFSSGSATEVYLQNSVDGINWSRSASFPAGASVVNALSWNGKLWVAGVYLSFGTPNVSLRYSYDGLTWFNSEGLGYSFGLSDVEWNGLYFLAAGYDSSTANYIQLSYDGIRWISMNQTGLGSDPTGLVWNGRYWIATANDGLIYTSYDARVWTTATGSMNIATYGIAYSSNAIQSYRQPNLEIAMNPIPIFLNSTNNIYATLSTVVINHGLYVSRANGNVGIGIGLPRKALDVNGEVQSIGVSTMQLFASSIGVGVSTVRYSLDVRGNGSFSTLTITGGAIVASTNTDFALTVFGTQGVARVGGTTWTAISDQRVKDHIVSADLERCYSDIKNIPLRRFTYTSTFFQDYNLKDKNVLGFIAQEVSTVQPKAITVSPGFGISDMMWLNIDQLNMSLYGSVKKLIQDKESADSTIRGQAFHLETLNGRMETMFSTLEGLQGR